MIAADRVAATAGSRAATSPGCADDAEVGARPMRARLLEDCDDYAVRCVRATSLLFPFLKTRIAGGTRPRRHEPAVVQEAELRRELRDDADLVAVLQIRPDAGT